jgi:hypothetical protein
MPAPTQRAAVGGLFFLAVLVPAATPLSSSAAPVSGATARFAVSISGEFTSSGQAAGPCWDADGNPIVTRRAAETTWTFVSTKAGRVQFSYLGGDLAAGMTKLMSVAGAGVRTATESPSCVPQSSFDLPFGSSCGPKRAKYLMSVYAAAGGGTRIGYSINKELGRLIWPDDPWLAVDRSCPPLALPWTKLNVNTAPPAAGISLAKVFNKRVRRIVLNGKNVGRETDPDAGSTWSLEYKIVLARRH